MLVAVLFGGRSYEHEVSILSGLLAVKLVETKERKVLPVYVDEENGFYDGTGLTVKDFAEGKKGKAMTLQNGGFKRGFTFLKVDVALNCCHGGLGEGGGLSALLEWFFIPSASPRMTESALFQDKYLSKLAVRSVGIPTVEGICLEREIFKRKKVSSLSLVSEKLGFPLILKPVRLGSSIGIAVVEGANELVSALETAFAFDDRVLIEKLLPKKRDLNCAVYDVGRLVISEPEEVVSSDTVLSYRDKYERERKVVPIEEEVRKEVKALSAKIYRRFSLSGVVRIDYLVSEGKVFFNELNVVPGSLAYYLFSGNLSEGKKMLSSLISEVKPVRHDKIPRTGLLKRDEIVRLNTCKIR